MSHNLEKHNELTKSDFLNDVLKNGDQEAFSEEALKFKKTQIEAQDAQNAKKALEEIRDLDLPTIGE